MSNKKLNRIDLSEEDRSDIEDLKTDLSSTASSDFVSPKTCSAPVSPSFINPISVSQRARSFEKLSTSFNFPTNKVVVMALKSDLKPVTGQRSALKGWVTRSLNKLKEQKTAGILSKQLYELHRGSVNGYIVRIEECEIKIAEIYDNHSVGLEDSDRILDSNTTYDFILAAQSELAGLEALWIADDAGGSGSGSSSNEELMKAVLGARSGISKISLNCPVFDSDSRDKLHFKDWFQQYEAVLNASHGIDDKNKLVYLRSKVKGTASSYLASLEVTNENYKEAIKLLKTHYEDKEFIKDELLKQILNELPGYDFEYTKTKLYIAKIKNLLNDLKRYYGVDLSTVNSGGNVLVSHIVFAKLSNELQRAFIQECKTCYPNFDQIFDNHTNIINTINKTRKKKPVKPEIDKNWRPDKIYSQPIKTDNFATTDACVDQKSPIKFHCRFCNIDGHSSLYCNRYQTFEQRKHRCDELKICCYCTSMKHSLDDCPGKRNNLFNVCRFCNGREHVSAMCLNRTSGPPRPKLLNNVCLSTGLDESQYVLPVLSIGIRGPNGPKVNFNALFDTASSRSYLSKDILQQLNIKGSSLKTVDYEVRTFLGMAKKSLKEVTLEVFLPSGRYVVMPLLVDDNFKIVMNVKGLKQAVKNFKNLNIKLAGEYSESDNQLAVQGLLGSDLIQFISELKAVKCINGTALEVASGIIPHGNIDSFLYPNQIKENCLKSIENSYLAIAGEAECSPLLVNFVLQPKYCFEDPTANFFDESSVERRVDKLLSCESLGINEDLEYISDFDKTQISKFEEGIEFIDNQVYVQLVWNENINKVPSNFNVCLAILNRVLSNLAYKELENDYCKYFEGQAADGIIEEFQCAPKEFDKYVWIPHRPVFKNDPQSTTPMRAVFNCSLKVGDNPSLNEASYAGINLMADMLELLLLFRTNFHVLLGDLKKAFLMIKLKELADRNRFCFFMRKGDKLICYRYKTLIFGFNSSPFILNYVIRDLANKFPSDNCYEGKIVC